MIYSISGSLAHTVPADAYFLVVVQTGGVGFEIKTTYNTMQKLPPLGGEATLLTHLNVREDALELFGFCDSDELNCFKLLLGVSGVGPKAALSVLSTVTPSQFALCVASGDVKRLSSAKGVGGKTAQRIILELKDKLTGELAAGHISDAPVLSAIGNTTAAEAISALVVLGYGQSESAEAVAALDQSLPVEELIKGALKALSRRI